MPCRADLTTNGIESTLHQREEVCEGCLMAWSLAVSPADPTQDLVLSVVYGAESSSDSATTVMVADHGGAVRARFTVVRTRAGRGGSIGVTPIVCDLPPSSTAQAARPSKQRSSCSAASLHWRRTPLPSQRCSPTTHGAWRRSAPTTWCVPRHQPPPPTRPTCSLRSPGSVRAPHGRAAARGGYRSRRRRWLGRGSGSRQPPGAKPLRHRH